MHSGVVDDPGATRVDGAVRKLIVEAVCCSQWHCYKSIMVGNDKQKLRIANVLAMMMRP